MEAAFGVGFASVQAHVGTAEARDGLAGLDARAAAVGERVAFAESSPDSYLVAHELAHVVQARNGGGGMQAKAEMVSNPGDASELAADRAADAVVRGDRVPDVGVANGITLHRAVNTNGGVFNNPTYAAYTPGTPNSYGFHAIIDFTANDLVEAPANQIGLIQTIKGDTNRVGATSTVNAKNDQPNTAVTSEPEEAGLVVPSGKTGAGRAVDVPIHRPGRTDANHNPIYGVGFGSADPSTDLTQGTPTLMAATRGDHIKNPNGSFQAANPAKIEDWPWRPIQVPGQTFEMTFEVAALVTGGPMANTYLGAIEWGWSGAGGTVTAKPFQAVASGAPTAGFMGAAKVWNDATFHTTDAAKTAVPSIDLPLTSLPSSVRAAVDLPTPALLARLAVVKRELTGLGGTDLTNRSFERTALEQELRRRQFTVKLHCDQLQDTGGAAVPAEDEVWLALTGPGAALTLTGQHKFRAGGEHTYTFSAADFLPLDGPIKIEVMEHDRAGKTGAEHDDTIMTLSWAPPFDPLIEFEIANGKYSAEVRFTR
jgi:hypothetical protein